MTLMLWVCGVAMTGLLLAAWREGRNPAPDRWWSYPVRLSEASIDDAPLRSSVRPALQTGVAILALALALDVAAEPQAWFAPLEPEAASGVATSAGLLDFTEGAGFSAYAPASWTVSASTSDGWFV